MDIKQEKEDMEEEEMEVLPIIDTNIVKEEYSMREGTSSYINGAYKLTSNWSVACPICNKMVAGKPQLAKHMTVHSKNRTIPLISCNICGWTFSRRVLLKEHMHTHSSDSEILLTCEVCYNGFRSQDELKSHYEIHRKSSKTPPEVSPIFNKNITEKTELEKHVEAHSDNTEGLKSGICGWSCLIPINMEYHMSEHSSENTFICQICSNEFTSKYELQIHIQTHRFKNSPQIACSICNKKVTGQSRLAQHMKVHTANRPRIKCNICDKTYPMWERLKKHMLTHNSENFSVCDICYNGFGSEDELNIHKATHNNNFITKDFINQRKNDRWKCMYCKCLNKSIYYIKQHIRIKHRGLPNIGDPSLKCTVCKMIFENLDELKAHTVVHSSIEDNYQCALCEKNFNRRILLKIHIHSTHLQSKSSNSSAKIFECFHCSKQFSMRRKLENHIVIHRNKRSVICKICNNAYKCYASFSRHMNTSHNGILTAAKEGFSVTCGICDDVFENIDEFKEHIITKHKNAKHISRSEIKRKCKLCSEKFDRNAELRDHIETVHLNERTSKATSRTIITTLNKLPTCNICGLTFENKRDLAGHEKQHIRRYELFSEQDIIYFNKKKMLNEYLNSSHNLPTRLNTQQVSPVVTEVVQETITIKEEEIDDVIYISD